MITCPNCTAQLPDDTIHCGECGHKVEPDSGMKTMFGMAALSPDNMAKAAEEAKAARQAADAVKESANVASEMVTGAAENVAGVASDAAPKLKLPSPGAPSTGLVEESSSVFDLPKPGGAFDDQKTIPVSALGLQAPNPDLSGQGPGFQSGPAPTFGTPDPVPTGGASIVGAEEFLGEDTGPSAFGSEFSPIDQSGTTGPTAFADTKPPGQSSAPFPSSQPANTSMTSGPTDEIDSMPGMAMGEEAPKSKTVLYVVGGVIIAMTLCCIISALVQFFVLA